MSPSNDSLKDPHQVLPGNTNTTIACFASGCTVCVVVWSTTWPMETKMVIFLLALQGSLGILAMFFMARHIYQRQLSILQAIQHK